MLRLFYIDIQYVLIALCFGVFLEFTPPKQPILNKVLISPYSVNISWVVGNVSLHHFNYTIQYGTDALLLDSSVMVETSGDINNVLSVNISGLTAFTKYYFVIVASNSIGSTTTTVMTFSTDETGM